MMALRFALPFVCLVALLCAVSGDSAQAGGAGKSKKVELRGTIKTGIVAAGGETTGTILQTKEGAYELDVPKNLRADVDKLNAKQAIVTGVLNVRKGIEVKERKIVTVDTVKAAP